jgi:hypothetical protein
MVGALPAGMDTSRFARSEVFTEVCIEVVSIMGVVPNVQ